MPLGVHVIFDRDAAACLLAQRTSTGEDDIVLLRGAGAQVVAERAMATAGRCSSRRPTASLLAAPACPSATIAASRRCPAEETRGSSSGPDALTGVPTVDIAADEPGPTVPSPSARRACTSYC
ncbi:hypothetical protein EVAR_20987_1 [Eumeta japonica]|uniref:Uncharacterized protein n=1 Tax=Eumeta variegata TaxID=151549 RepID=A0A4C1V667_EUMVA|nr:hypothetical protein EVAR_20987_1 [Eumeta japonica]